MSSPLGPSLLLEAKASGSSVTSEQRGIDALSIMTWVLEFHGADNLVSTKHYSS